MDSISSISALPVTVIMPAYNAEKTLERSVKSVLSQDWPNLHLMVVDDGSRDATLSILRRFAAEDARITVLHTENSGPAMARNTALEAFALSASEEAKKGFVTFMDADDELEPGALSYAMEKAGRADLILFGFIIREPDGRKRLYSEEDGTYDRAAMKTAFSRLYKANLLNQVWGKLFSASLLLSSGLRFQDYLWGEDRIFVFDYLEKADTVSVRSACKYSYVMHPGESLISRYIPGKIDACIAADRRALALSSLYGSGDHADLRYMFAKSVFSCLTTLFSPGCTLTKREKLTAVKDIACREEVRTRCRDTSGGAAPNILCGVLRTGNAELILKTFHVVALLSTHLPDLVMKIKHRK